MTGPTTNTGRAFLREPFRIDGLSRPIGEYIAAIEAEAREQATHHDPQACEAGYRNAVTDWLRSPDAERRLARTLLTLYPGIYQDYPALCTHEARAILAALRGDE